MAHRRGKQWKQWKTLFSWAPKSLWMVTVAMKLKDAYSLEGKLWPPRQHIKKQRHCFAKKGPSNQRHGFSHSHVWMWELDCEESWVLKNWCFWTVEKALESPLNCKRSNQSLLKEINPEYSLERLILKLKLLLWPPDVKCRLIGKDPDAGKDWRQEDKGMIENEMIGWHHWLNGPESEQALGDGGQGSLVCWVHGIAKNWTWLSVWATVATIHPVLMDGQGLWP